MYIIVMENISFTFVTALYECSRVNYDGRTFQEYQEWFKKTLTIPVPMVIYTEEKNRELVEKSRKSLPTKVFYTTLEEVPFFYTRAQVSEIIRNTKNDSETNLCKLLEKHPNHLEFNCMDYIPIINSKFVWMTEAIKQNWFHTEMFFWIDAGLSRFMDFDVSMPQWNRELIYQIHNHNRLYLQIGKENEFNELIHGHIKVEDTIGLSINFMMAGFWGGNRNFMLEICETGSKLYLEEFIGKNCVDNEQVLFGFLLKKYKNKLLSIPSYKEYYNYYLFTGRGNTGHI